MLTNTMRRNDFGPIVSIALMITCLLIITSIIGGIDHINEGVSGGHANHEDTITTPMVGNCPDCGWEDCGGCDGKTVLTLFPTQFITALATLAIPATPDIPDPEMNLTTFPTLIISTLPAPPVTVAPPTLMPTPIPDNFPDTIVTPFFP